MSLERNAKRGRIATDSVEKEMIDGVWSNDPLLQLEATTKFRMILSNETSPTQSVIESGVVPRFIEFLRKEDSPKLQCEAAWVLTIIAFDKPEEVIDNGTVPILVDLLASPYDDIAEKAIWALNNVADGSAKARFYVLSCKVLPPLLNHLNEKTKLSLLRIATRTLANLCRGKPPLPFDQVKLALPKVKRLLHSYDEQVLSSACSAVWHMSCCSDNVIRVVIETGFVPRLVQLLQHTSPSVRRYMLGTIYCILSIDTQQIQHVIHCGVLPILAKVLNQDCEEFIKVYGSWMIKKITVNGTKEQIKSVIDAKLIPILVNLAQDAEVEIKMKAVWAISNAIIGGSHDQVRYMVEKNCIKPLCDSLVCEDVRVVFACLDGLENILKVGEAEKNEEDPVNYYRQEITDAGGHEKTKNLRSHDIEQIKEKAVDILETYWPGEEYEK